MVLELKIITLNCWGIPFVSKDRRARMQAIADILKNSDYDVACLQEVWTNSDYDLIRHTVEKTLPYSHYFYSGVVGSGVCVLSKYLIQEVFFHQWPVNGYIHKLQHGDWFGGKGVGMVRLSVNNFKINIYSAHLHAEYDRTCDEYMAHRVLQAFDTAQFIRLTSTNADLAVLAGDLNTEPGDLAYRVLIAATDMIDAYTTTKDSKKFLCTNEGLCNSYTDEKLIQKKYQGKRIDYVMYKCSDDICVTLKKYEHPLPERVPGKEFSYSDHEAVSACLQISPVLSSKTLDNSESVYETVLTESMEVCDEALLSLAHHKRFYTFLTLALFIAIVFTTGINAPLGFIKTYTILRILLTGLMFFTLIMATLWNKIEYHAVIAGKYAMKVDLQRLQLNNADCKKHI